MPAALILKTAEVKVTRYVNDLRKGPNVKADL